jgi:predicted transcriptional regulator
MKESEAVWAVANLGVATANEVSEVFDDESTLTSNTSQILLNCYRNGLLVRRKREGPQGSRSPYEYAVAELDRELVGGRFMDDVEADT